MPSTLRRSRRHKVHLEQPFLADRTNGCRPIVVAATSKAANAPALTSRPSMVPSLYHSPNSDLPVHPIHLLPTELTACTCGKSAFVVHDYATLDVMLSIGFLLRGHVAIIRYTIRLIHAIPLECGTWTIMSSYLLSLGLTGLRTLVTSSPNFSLEAMKLECLVLQYSQNDDDKEFTLFGGFAPRLTRLTLDGLFPDSGAQTMLCPEDHGEPDVIPAEATSLSLRVSEEQTEVPSELVSIVSRLSIPTLKKLRLQDRRVPVPDFPPRSQCGSFAGLSACFDELRHRLHDTPLEILTVEVAGLSCPYSVGLRHACYR
ncbi:hypothetical protein BU15DRAFT_60291 [Melanogaster broomeanus]|nr:hypothetical protein BU15DRAFT_60291 [Melanogaster broomeanus]